MSDQLPDVPALRSIDPPPGGLAALRTRIDRPRRRRWWFAAVPAVAAAALIALLVLRPERNSVEVDAGGASERALRDREIGGSDMPFYWVASRPGGAPPRESRRPAVTTVSLDDAPRVTTFRAP